MLNTAEQTPQLHPRIEELIEFLGVHRRGVYEAVAAVPASLRDRKPAPDRWSVAEVVEHLTIVEQRVAALLTMRVTAARASGVGPDPETSSVVESYPNPHAVIDRTRRASAPSLVQPTGTVDTTTGTRALVQAHAAMVSALQNASGVSLTEMMQTHPVFGPLNLYHFIVALGLHDQRHAAQIREIGESFAAT
jgi:DinB superfamily